MHGKFYRQIASPRCGNSQLHVYPLEDTYSAVDLEDLLWYSMFWGLKTEHYLGSTLGAYADVKSLRSSPYRCRSASP